MIESLVLSNPGTCVVFLDDSSCLPAFWTKASHLSGPGLLAAKWNQCEMDMATWSQWRPLAVPNPSYNVQLAHWEIQLLMTCILMANHNRWINLWWFANMVLSLKISHAGKKCKAKVPLKVFMVHTTARSDSFIRSTSFKSVVMLWDQ